MLARLKTSRDNIAAARRPRRRKKGCRHENRRLYRELREAAASRLYEKIISYIFYRAPTPKTPFCAHVGFRLRAEKIARKAVKRVSVFDLRIRIGILYSEAPPISICAREGGG